MNSDNKLKLIKIKNFQKISKPKRINFNKSFLKVKTNFFRHINIPNSKAKSLENSKIILNEDNKKNISLILPSVPITSTNSNQKIQNSSSNNIFPNINNKSPKKIIHKKGKIKIRKPNEDNEIFVPYKQNKSLINIYKENLVLKKRLQKYKIRKPNLGKFSYENYNYNLIQYSSMDLSMDNVYSFKKNMQIIKKNMNGNALNLKNHWLVLLHKINNIAPERLQKKLKSLSEVKPQKEENKKIEFKSSSKLNQFKVYNKRY